MQNTLSGQGAATFFTRLVAGAFILLAITYGLTGFRSPLEEFCVSAIILLSVILCVRTRKNTLAFLVSFSIAYSNYSAMTANYSNGYALESTYDSMYAGTWVAAEGTFVLLLFMATVVLFLPSVIGRTDFGDFFARYDGRYSIPVVLAILCLLAVIWVTCSSGFGGSGRGDSNQLFEYSYIIFILGFYFSGKRKSLQISMLSMAALFILQNVLTGNRAGVLGIILIIYALYFSQRWGVGKALPVILVGFFAFQTIGIFREEIASSLGEIPQAIAQTVERRFVWDTASYAYHQSLAFVRLAHDAGLNELSYLAQRWFLSIFLGGSAVPDSLLATYVQQLYPGMGGGFLPLYGYCYFGILGVLLTGIGVSLVLRAISGASPMNRDIGLMLRLCLFATVFRWYLYSPSPLTRGVLLMLVIGAVALFVFKTLEQKRGVRRNKHGARVKEIGGKVPLSRD